MEQQTDMDQRAITTRVVSMPSWELFDEQDQAYRDAVLPPDVAARVTVEEASPIGWHRFAVVLGMQSFGISAPMKVVAENFDFTAEHVVAVAKDGIDRSK